MFWTYPKRRMAEPPRRLLHLTVAATTWLAAGCDPGPIELLDPVEDAPAGTGVLTVRVAASPGSGLSGGAASGARIYYARTHSKGFPWDSVTADESGVAVLRDLPGGLYWIAARGAGTDQASGAGEKVELKAGDSLAMDVPLFAHRAESLVISEFYGAAPPVWVVATRGESKYLELYNNSPFPVYLDGLLIGQFYSPYFDGGVYNHSRCSVTEPYRNDPTALWSDVMWKFPGTGSSYPVRPGETVLIAVSAADHRSRHETFLDLTGADFEFLPDAGGADNPAVPTMIQVGTR
ncbi:MAG TPA: DUF4876 domain-containing protein, partial [Longimicrobiales bacterium]|nr:DUF4876 domain-containing protein [Longimicrobiales bacterium]